MSSDRAELVDLQEVGQPRGCFVSQIVESDVAEVRHGGLLTGFLALGKVAAVSPCHSAFECLRDAVWAQREDGSLGLRRQLLQGVDRFGREWNRACVAVFGLWQMRRTCLAVHVLPAQGT